MMTNNNLCLEETIEALAIGLSDPARSKLLLLTVRIDGDDDRGGDLCLAFSRQSENEFTANGSSVPMSAYFEFTSGGPSFAGSGVERLILTPLFDTDSDHWPAKISTLLMGIAEREQYGDPNFSIVHARTVVGTIRCIGRDTQTPQNSMYKVFTGDTYWKALEEPSPEEAHFNSTD